MQYILYPNVPNVRNLVATTGFFDGVHHGHQAVLQRVVKVAQQRNQPSCVITFWPHPRIVLKKDVEGLRLLSTLEEKKRLIAQAGIDYLLVIPFTLELAGLSADVFFDQYLVQALGVSYLIVGYDHHFGKGGQADFGQIKQLGDRAGVPVEQVAADAINEVTVSSSKIRHALQSGDVALANQCLGYAYTISGTVIHGKKLGRQLGFPTANIQPDEELKLLPQYGIYAVEVFVANNSRVYIGMLSIGIRPTVDDERKCTIEVNIFDFNDDIYDEAITVCFIERLRDEWKFDTLEALRQQIAQDKIDTLSVFERRR